MRSAAAATAAPPPTPESMSTDEEQAARRRERLPRTPPESEESEQSEAIERDAQEEPERLAFPLKAFFVACTSALEAVALTEAKRLVATGTANAKLALPKWTHPLIAGDLKDATALAAAALMGHVSVVRYLVGELGADARDVKLAAIRTEQTMKTETETITGSRALCKSGEVWSYEGKKGTLTMNPDSDNEVKLRWLSGGTSSYINTSRLTKEISTTVPKTVTTTDVMTLLELACCGGHLPTVQYLLEQNEDTLPSVRSNPEATHRAFAMACSSRSESSLDTIKYLAETLEVDANHPLGSWSCCVSAVEGGELVQMSGTGVTAFGAACMAGPVGAISFLVEDCGVDLSREHFESVRVGEEASMTPAILPLLGAVIRYGGSLSAVQFLSSRLGVDLGAPLAGMGGCTAIGLAIEAGKLEIVRHLAEEHAVNLARPLQPMTVQKVEWQCIDPAGVGVRTTPSEPSDVANLSYGPAFRDTIFVSGSVPGTGDITAYLRLAQPFGGVSGYVPLSKGGKKLFKSGSATQQKLDFVVLPLQLAIDNQHAAVASYVQAVNDTAAQFFTACTSASEVDGLFEARRLMAVGNADVSRTVPKWTHPAVTGELLDVTVLAAMCLMGRVSIVKYLVEELGAPATTSMSTNILFVNAEVQEPDVHHFPAFFVSSTSSCSTNGDAIEFSGHATGLLNKTMEPGTGLWSVAMQMESGSTGQKCFVFACSLQFPS